MSKMAKKIGAEIKFKEEGNEALIKLVADFTPDEVEEFNKYEADAQLEMLNVVARLQGDAANLEGKIDLVEESTTGGFDETACPILRPGGIGLREGSTLTAMFLGTEPMYSDKPKTNWKTREFDINGKATKYWINSFFKFQDTQGNEFGIFDSPTLRILRKVLTHNANELAGVAKNPVVHLHYVGKVEGVARLKEEYGITLTDGNSCHVFKVRVEKGARVERSGRGVLNYLSNPVPSAGAEDISDVELMERNYAATQRPAQLEGEGQLQIAQ